MPTRACDRCDSAAVVPLFDYRDYISGETFAIVRCGRCGLARTDFPYDAAALERYYGKAYYGNRGQRFLGPLERLIGGFRQARVGMITRLHPDPGTILDVGAGRGLMLAGLQARGWTCYGTEVSAELAARLAAQNIIIYDAPHLPDHALPAASFDVITLWHSLEHVEFPAQTLAEVARLLKPGGLLIVEVPNLQSWQAAVGRGRWFHLDAPRHLTHFSAPILRAMIAENGLSVVSETTLSWEQGFYGMVQTLLNYITTEPNVLYSLIKKTLPRSRGGRLVWDIGATLMLGLPALLVGVPLEALSVIFRRGAVIQIVARKGESGPHPLPLKPERGKLSAD